MVLKDNKFLVTGAASGIGKALVLALIEQGASVVALDLNQEALLALEKETDKKKLKTKVLDITDKKATTEIATEYMDIDGIINNAGIIQPFLRVGELDYKAIERVMQVNFYGTLYLTKAFLPHLLKRPEGYIINVSSMGGFLPVPGQGIYGASKAAVKLFTEALYAELRDTNVHVSIVFPGATNTNITKNSNVTAPKDTTATNYSLTSPEEAARKIIRGILKNKSRIFTGKDSRSMDFLYRISPTFATNLIARKMKSLLGGIE
ncbi:MAG: SDR family NAD(P)-dependent oxidoreductase [Patescibacteria group bacterium]|nr:SDR family NAD(P)-dependent oxidoreductase [Patescibacteria group bacterium]